MRSVFISSTFKDMQAERDYLHERVFPKLRKLAGQYGEDIQELDLRWGVDTYQMSEEESGCQVLRVCIDAIDRCKPYIVVLLGDRYGWIPDEGIVESMRDERLSRQYEASMSITNLEIKYGALSEEETLKRCIFCFRNPDFAESIPEDRRSVYLAESPEHEKKLRALKEQIRAKKNAKVIGYRVRWDEERQMISGLEQLGEEVYRLLAGQLESDLAGRKAKNPVEQRILEAQCTKERYLASYTPKLFEEREAVEEMWFMAGAKYDRHIDKRKIIGEEEHCIHLTGGAGSGKSALMASLEQQARNEGAQTILYFSGNPGCQRTETLKSVIIYRLEEILGIPHGEPQGNLNACLRTLDQKAEKIPIYCFIDALDQLFPPGQDRYLDIPDLCPNLYVITSSPDDFPYQDALIRARKMRVIEIHKFADYDKKALIRITADYRGKKMDEVLEEQICQKENSGNPLYLSMLLQRLFAMRQEEFERAELMAAGIDGLHLYMKKLIEDFPETMTEAAAALFDYVGHMFRSEFFRDVAYMVALSETGLTEREIGEMLKLQGIGFSQLKFQEILSYLYSAFTENDGKWVYAHRIFYEAMRRDMGDGDEKIRGYFIAYSRENPEFLAREGFYHVLRRKDPLGKTVLTECGQWGTFRQVKRLVKQMISEDKESEDYFLSMTKEAEPVGLFSFWKEAQRGERENDFPAFIRKLYENFAAREDLPVELRIEALEILRQGDRPEESARHFEAARRLIPQLADEGSRTFWKIKHDYWNVWNIVDAGGAEEGFALLDRCIEGMRGLIPNPHLAGEAVCLCIHYSWVFLWEKRERQKELNAGYFDAAMDLYVKYPEYTKNRKASKLQAELYLEGVYQYEKTDPEKAKQCATEALKLARDLSGKYPDTDMLELLMRSLTFYGHEVDRDSRYQYRYEALEVAKRAYQMERTDYWQEQVASSAGFFAKDISELVQQLKLEDCGVWMNRGKNAWNLCFSCYEQLLEKGYIEDPAYYVDCLLACADENVFQYYAEYALKYAKKAYDCLKTGRENGREPAGGKELRQNYRASILLAENLDDLLQAQEAKPYAQEAVVWARKLHKENASPNNRQRLLESLRVAARVLYHTGCAGEALAMAKETEELLLQFQKENTAFPEAHAEIAYILARLFLKQGDIPKAEEYAEIVGIFEQLKNSDFWGEGKLLLLKGDIRLAKGAYDEARDAYHEAASLWRSCHEQVKKISKGRLGFKLENGKATRDVERRLWHVKTFFYHIRALCRESEAMYTGKIGELGGNAFCAANSPDLSSAWPMAHRKRMREAFELCLDAAQNKDYRAVAESFLLPAMDKLLLFAKEAGWGDAESMDTIALFGKLSVYCKGRGIDLEQQYEAIAEAFSAYRLPGAEVSLSVSVDGAFYSWLNIYAYLKRRMDEGLPIHPYNNYLFGYMWFLMGCYRDACRWFDAFRENEGIRSWAKVHGLVCHAMCAYHDGDGEAFAEWMRQIERAKEAESEAWSRMLEELYEEMKGSVAGFFAKVSGTIRTQEHAQRCLNRLKIAAESGAYFAMGEEEKQHFWLMAHKICDAYYKGNEEKPGQETASGRWDDRAASLRKLTNGGMLWETDFAHIDDAVLTVLRTLYDACPDAEEKKNLSGKISKFWWDESAWKEYRFKPERLSTENIELLCETERLQGHPMNPPMAAELAFRRQDKEMLHTFFAGIPESSKMRIQKGFSRERTIEVKDIFERLLAQDPDEWTEDFRRWFPGDMWVVAEMDFYRRAEELDAPATRPLYEAYREYQTAFKEKWREKWAERLKQCAGGG